MNLLVVVVILFLAVYALNGRRRGFIRTVFALFSMIIALIITSSISPVISKELQKNDKVIDFVKSKVSKVVNFDEAVNKKSDQVNFVDKLPLPKSMRDTLVENNTKDVYTAMAVDKFEDYVTNMISRIIINAAVYVAVMIIIIIGLAVLCEALDIISKLPIINGLNKTAGLLAGLLHGIIMIWIGCIILTMFSSTKFGQTLFVLINESEFLGIIYNNNLLLKFILNLGKILF